MENAFVNKLSDPFVAVPREIVNDKTLSFKAKGLWMYLKDKPTGWRFSVARIVSQTADGRDAIKSGLKELEQVGLLKRTKMKNSKGEFCGICYELLGLPVDGKPVDGKPADGKPANISNTHISNTHVRKTQSTTKVVEGKPSDEKLVGLEISSESGLIPKGKPKPATSDNRNSLIEKALDIWEDVMGVRPAFEKDKTQRSYAFNIMRRKDRGGEWLRKMLILLRNAKATEYTSAKITNISDFKSLFYGVDILTQWGQSRADQKRVSKKGMIDLDNMD